MKRTAYREPRSNAGKPVEAAARLGQVFTPARIADLMVSQLLSMGSFNAGATILDPCIGSAALPKALVRAGLREFSLFSYEIDSQLADLSDAWIQANIPTSPAVTRADYLQEHRPIVSGYDAAIANPPYIRQEWIEDKATYQSIAAKEWRANVPGTANLYVYFIVSLILSLRPGGIISIVIYDSWSHTKYGRWLVDFINKECDAATAIPVPDAPFEGRLIDATVISARRAARSHRSKSPLDLPSKGLFHSVEGFTPLKDEYWTKRGLRLKQASFFMGSATDIEHHGATRFVKKPAKINGLVVPENHPESALLLPLNGDPDPRVVQALNRRLADALNDRASNQSVLNWFEHRPTYWQRHPDAPKAPILFNYYFRTRPKHIFNPYHIHYSDNYYGLIPENGMLPAASYALLNCTAVALELDAHGRRQGNGLNKLQLYEYRAAYIPSRKLFSAPEEAALDRYGRQVAAATTVSMDIVRPIDTIVYRASGRCDALKPLSLIEQARNKWSK